MAYNAEAAPPGLAAWAAGRSGGPAELRALTADGGLRRYFRLPGRGLLALFGPDPAENLAWLTIGRHLWFQGLSLPRLYDYDLKRGFFLLEDLGDRRLADPPDITGYYRPAVELLAELHRRGLRGFNPAWGQTRAYDPVMVREQEIGYFLHQVLIRYLGWPGLPPGLKAEARRLAVLAAGPAEGRVLIHRDYQARNLMIKEGRVYFIDWQGARPGPAAYDLAALLQETPYIPLSRDFQEELIELYLRRRGRGLRPAGFRRQLLITGAARLMQAGGAYAKISLSGRARFADYLPPVVGGLAARLAHPALGGFSALRAAVERAAAELGA